MSQESGAHNPQIATTLLANLNDLAPPLLRRQIALGNSEAGRDTDDDGDVVMGDDSDVAVDDDGDVVMR